MNSMGISVCKPKMEASSDGAKLLLSLFALFALAFGGASAGGGCQPGWYRFGNKCILYSKAPKSYELAQKNCDKISGSQLFEPRDIMVENGIRSWVASQDRGAPKYGPWIGLRIGINGSLSYAKSSQETPAFQQFSRLNDAKKGTCVHLFLPNDIEGRWSFDDCFSQHGYICEMPTQAKYQDGPDMLDTWGTKATSAVDMEQVRGLERQLKSLQAKLDNSETEAAKLRRELQKAEIDVSDLNRYTKMLTHMKDNSDKAKEEAIKERLKAEDLLREAKQARNDAEIDLMDMEDELDDANFAMEVLREELNSSMINADNAFALRDEAILDLEMALDEIDEVELLLSEASDELDEANEAKHDLEVQLNTTSESLSMAENQNAMLHDEMAMLNGTIGDLEFVMEELNDQLDDKNEELQTKEIEMDELQYQLIEKDDLIQEKEEQILETLQDLEYKEEQFEETLRDLDDVTAILEQKKKELVSMAEELHKDSLPNQDSDHCCNLTKCVGLMFKY